MHLIRLVIIVLAVGSLSSCLINSSDSYKEIDVVTGLDLFDENGLAIGRWQIPNHSSEGLTVFPVPSTGIINVSSLTPLTNFWVIESDCDGSDDEDILDLVRELDFTTQQLTQSSILDSTVDNLGSFQIDMTMEGEGFHKVFVLQESGTMVWQNIYVDPAVTNFPDFDFLDGVCN